jgi:hypothetical protein
VAPYRHKFSHTGFWKMNFISAVVTQ